MKFFIIAPKLPPEGEIEVVLVYFTFPSLRQQGLASHSHTKKDPPSFSTSVAASNNTYSTPKLQLKTKETGKIFSLGIGMENVSESSVDQTTALMNSSLARPPKIVPHSYLTSEIILKGVQKFVPILTPLFSLAWVSRSGSYSTCWTSDVLGFVWCIKLWSTINLLWDNSWEK